MSISFNTGVAQVSSVGLSSYALTIPAGVHSGDLLIYIVYSGFNTSANTLSVSSTGTALSQVGSGIQVTGFFNFNFAIYQVVATNSDPGAVITATDSAGSGTFGAALAAYTGAGSVDVHSMALIAGGTTWTDPKVTTTVNGDWSLEILMGDRNANDVITPPSLVTSREVASDTQGAYIQITDSGIGVGNAGTSIGGGTWTSSASEPSTQLVVATLGIQPSGVVPVAPGKLTLANQLAGSASLDQELADMVALEMALAGSVSLSQEVWPQ